MTITKDTTIEELVEKIPQAVTYLSKSGIRCVICGEPIWGTLENAAKEKGFNDDDVARFVADLNRLRNNSSDTQASVS
jgi:iron-sulfur cluster repair protein YtfE (RIC family)